MSAHNYHVGVGTTILRRRFNISVVKRETYNPFLKVFNTIHELLFYLITLPFLL